MRAMKDSGVEWIGEIPVGWSIRKLKTLVLEQDSIFIDGDWIESKDISSRGIRYYTSGNVGDGVFKHQGHCRPTEVRNYTSEPHNYWTNGL